MTLLDRTSGACSAENLERSDVSYWTRSQPGAGTSSGSTSSSTSPGYTERHYQLSALAALREGIRNGMKRQVLVAPTGSGKTVTAAGIVRRAVAKGSTVYFLAHRRELIDQCSNKLAESGVDHGVIMANHWRKKPRAAVQVASVQTLIRRMHHVENKKPDIIIIDESHRSTSFTYVKIIEACPNAIIIGLTATPERADGKGLGEIYQGMVQTVTVQQLIDQGFLVPPRVFAPSRPDLKGVHIARGDYDTKELADAMDRADLVGNVIEHWRKHARHRPTVAFEVNVARSLRLRDKFRAAGVVAEHLDGSISDKERPAILDRWRRGVTQVVTNCEVLTEGFDLPALAAVVLCRPTRSLGLYLQMVGRGLRPWPGKPDCIILDHAGAVYEHGLPQEDREWSLEGRKKRNRQQSLRVVVCPNCFASFTPKVSRVCPECGWRIPVKEREINHDEDGALEEISLEQAKRARKREVGKAQTLEELQLIGRQRGYKPGWARYVWESRQRRMAR